MTTLEGHTSREIRGRIMKILSLNYPQQTGDKLIAEILLDAQYSTTPAAVETHLVYLREKGYIAICTQPVVRRRRCSRNGQLCMYRHRPQKEDEGCTENAGAETPLRHSLSPRAQRTPPYRR